ncbi:hypothetical protein BOMU111920_01635 [Bordetella muralis]
MKKQLLTLSVMLATMSASSRAPVFPWVDALDGNGAPDLYLRSKSAQREK